MNNIDFPFPRYEEGLLNELENPHSSSSYHLKQLISELADAITAAEELEGGAYGAPLPAEIAEAIVAAEGIEGGADGRPLPYDVAEALAEAEEAAVMGGGMARPWEDRNPRYMRFTEYQPRNSAEVSVCVCVCVFSCMFVYMSLSSSSSSSSSSFHSSPLYCSSLYPALSPLLSLPFLHVLNPTN